MKKAIEIKNAQVLEISEKFKSAKSVVVFEYKGLTVADLTTLRKEIHNDGCEIKVVKNNISRRASNELGYKEFAKKLEGPNAIGIGYNDEVSLVKALSDFAKKNDNLKIKAGIINATEVDEEYLVKLASIPPRDELLTILAVGMMQPVRQLGIALKMLCDEKENK